MLRSRRRSMRRRAVAAAPLPGDVAHTNVSGATVLNEPAGLAAGDLQILHLLAIDTTQGGDVTTVGGVSGIPEAWTRVTDSVITTDGWMNIWARVRVVGDSAPTVPAPGTQTASLFRIPAGTHGGIDAAASAESLSTPDAVAPSITTTVDNCLLLCFAGSDLVAAQSYTPPAGMTELYDRYSTTSFPTATCAYQQLGAAGPTGTRTFTLSATDHHAASSVAVKPA